MTVMATELIRVGEFVAEVDVQLHDDAGEFSPAVSLADARKIEAVRLALEVSDIAAAERLGRVYRLLRVSA